MTGRVVGDEVREGARGQLVQSRAVINSQDLGFYSEGDEKPSEDFEQECLDVAYV